MRRIPQLAVFCALIASGCAPVIGERAVVAGTGEEEFLNLRAGPGLGFAVILGLPDGTAVNRQECITELGQLWCKVSLDGAPGLTGYVSADYLVAP